MDYLVDLQAANLTDIISNPFTVLYLVSGRDCPSVICGLQMNEIEWIHGQKVCEDETHQKEDEKCSSDHILKLACNHDSLW